MARPQKQTVDYFSHDADASQGRTLSILFNNFGHEGISCWWQLLERISSTNNHVISLRNGEDLEYLAAKLRFHSDRLKEILVKMAELEAIDSKLFEHGLIWSQNLVDRLEQVYKTRKQTLPLKPSLITKDTKLIKKETELPIPETPQTKLKETKLNNTKEEKATPERQQIEFEEYVEELRKEYPDLNFDNELKKFQLWWSEGNRKLIRPKSALRNWMDKAREFKEERKGGLNQGSPKKLPNQYTKPEDL